MVALDLKRESRERMVGLVIMEDVILVLVRS